MAHPVQQGYPTFDTPPLDARSKQLRALMVRMLKGGRRGHIGSTLSLMEIFRVLYDDVLKYDAKNPKWKDRDRCVLSKGHGCIALYAILADKGFFPMEELDKFCMPDGILGGHPEYNKIPGVEASTGALGHGLSIGVGMALAARAQKKNHRVFVIMGDGEINEGSVWEAAMSAAHHGLSNLICIVDINNQQADGPSELGQVSERKDPLSGGVAADQQVQAALHGFVNGLKVNRRWQRRLRQGH